MFALLFLLAVCREMSSITAASTSSSHGGHDGLDSMWHLLNAGHTFLLHEYQIVAERPSQCVS
jgi:hypothetical protein